MRHPTKPLRRNVVPLDEFTGELDGDLQLAGGGGGGGGGGGVCPLSPTFILNQRHLYQRNVFVICTISRSGNLW